MKSQWRIASPPKAHTQTVMLKRPFRKHLWVQSFADAFDLSFFGGIPIWTKQSEIFYLKIQKAWELISNSNNRPGSYTCWRYQDVIPFFPGQITTGYSGPADNQGSQTLDKLKIIRKRQAAE